MPEYKIYPTHEIFPIKSKTGCLLKWSWSTINMEKGTSASCHRTKGYKINPDNFGDFHNLPEKIKDRERMLAGEWPGHGCEYCKNVEDHQGTSDRLMTLSQNQGTDKIPPELFNNPLVTSVTPTILEIYFNNICNLTCAYCGPGVSSQWNDEIRKFGPIKLPGGSIDRFVPDNARYDKMVSDLWEYLVENNRYKTIRHYHILGGEPLLQKELDQSISFWEDHPNPSLTFNIITNLMVPHDQFVKKISQFEKLVKSNAIYILEVTASLDGWGPEQEYVRYGIDLDTWTKNFEYMLDKTWINLAIHSCMNVLTIKTMPELMTKINEWNKLKLSSNPINHSFDLVIGCEERGLHPKVFGGGVFDSDFEKIIDLMPITNSNQLNLKKQMQGLANFVKNSPKNPDKISALIEYLDELDRRRNTNWKTIFSWIATVS
jgi:hypothetical protein